MACTSLSAGRLEVCKDIVGGLNAIYFINFEDATFQNGDVSFVNAFFGNGFTNFKNIHF